MRRIAWLGAVVEPRAGRVTAGRGVRRGVGWPRPVKRVRDAQTSGGERRFVSLGEITRDQAERELRGVLADVERGIWRPSEPAKAPPVEPTFHEFVEQWFVEHSREWRPATVADYRWRLESHLLPFFDGHNLTAITIAEVDRYKAHKLAAGELSGESINKTLKTLAAVLDVAVERELIARNPAAGKRRRVKATTPKRSYLDTAGQLAALLDAARELDCEARPDRQRVRRHAMIATLTFAGLRIGELLALRWDDVDLAAGRLRVGEAKTDARRRHVTIRPALREVLIDLKAQTLPKGSELLFAGMTATNFRRRTLTSAVGRANERLAANDLPALPDGLTPHSLRRTFASLLYALGEPPPVVMAEMGHTDPALALRIYARAMRRDAAEVERLRALVDGAALPARHGASEPGTVPSARVGRVAQ